MRISAIVIPLAAFALAAALSVGAAMTAVAVVEDRSVEAVQEELYLQGHDWARVLGDGLQIVIEGEAPSEAVRFRAMSVAGSVVDASRVIDNMSVPDAEGIAPPEFSIEILRNDGGISLIGLMPAATDRDAVLARVTRMAGDLPVTDLLEAAEYPVPEGWRRSLDFALDTMVQLPRSKISIAPGEVRISAISDDAAQKARLETAIARRVPDGVSLALSITAPRPVITPFTTRFVIDADGPRFEACSADTAEAQAAITAAAVAAGVEGKVACTLGLGAPAREWGEAVTEGIEALAALGGGTVTYSDADVVLVAAAGTPREDFDRVVGELGNALPEAFALDAVLPVAQDAESEGPAQFTATRTPEGAVRLRGPVPDALMNDTVANFAHARFGAADVTMGTRVADGLPQGWSVRVLAGIEALSRLGNGSVLVEPDLVAVRGNTGDADAGAAITRLMIEKLGQSAEFSVDVTYVEALDPVAGLPTPEECIAQINALTVQRKITFEPGSANIDAGTVDLVNDIADVLRGCLDLPLRIAGYTDSQGRDEMNQRLSQQRADAVLTALRSRRVPTSSFVAVGFGEADPIADNATEEGRESNRRIEFSLIAEETGDADEEAAADGEGAVAGDGDGAAADGEGAATGDGDAAAAADGEAAPSAAEDAGDATDAASAD